MEGNHGPGKEKRRRLEDNRDLASGLSSSCSGNEQFLHNCFNGRSKVKTAVIFDNAKGKVEELKYEELDQFANLVKNAVNKLCSEDNNLDDEQEFIGIKCELGVLYPILILGVLRSGNAFYNIDPDNGEGSLEDGVNQFGMKYVLTNRNWTETARACKLKEIRISPDNLSFQIYTLKSRGKTKKKLPKENFAYAIQTSGTTGQKKTIFVPHACICPNIKDFVEDTWKITERDVIFGSAPPTFDPHLVELFSALSAGATILYTTSDVKLNGSLLGNVLAYHQVTILQITPTLFRRLSTSISKHQMTHLRIVAFGGEKCPEKGELSETLSKFTNENFMFQNVYGVTEVSCWASASIIDLNSPEPVTIGNALRDTEITVYPEPEGEIIISSETRHCLIIDPSATQPIIIPTCHYRTGDMGRSTPTGIIFQGRKDRVVKRNGMKVSMHQIEMMTLSTGLVSYAECKLHEGKIYLLVKLKTEYDNQAKSLLPTALTSKLELPLFMFPDCIIPLNQNSIPLNGNGKIDLDLIIQSFFSSACSEDCIPFNITRHQVVNTLAPVWKSCTSIPGGQNNLQENFIAAGGTSISATRFVESTFMSLKLFGSEVHQKWEQDLTRYLLNEDDGTFGGIVEKILTILAESNGAIRTNLSSLEMDLLREAQEPLPRNVSLPSTHFEFQFMDQDDVDEYDIFNPLEEIPEKKKPLVISAPPQPSEFHTFPLGLCVDASPTKVPNRNQIIIGCHGGILLSIDLDLLRQYSATPSDAIGWRRKFPNRIEASVEVHPNSLIAYFGCHDGIIYKISVVTGEVICWNACGGEGIPIRSKCAACNDLVIFVNSANSIYCVDSHTLNVQWIVSSFKLLATASPVIFRGQCFVSTLDRGIIAVDNVSGTVLWTAISGQSNLIYSSPKLIFTRKGAKRRRGVIIVCTSNEGVEAREVLTGGLRWQHKSQSSHHVLQPLFNECCDNLLWIDNTTPTSSRLKFLEPETGREIGSFRILHSGPITPSLLYARKENCEKKCCYLCYKTSTEVEGTNLTTCPLLTFVSLHEILPSYRIDDKEQMLTEAHITSDVDNLVVKQWIMDKKSDFETFSVPTISSEFIAFGGRDNNLHVIKLKV